MKFSHHRTIGQSAREYARGIAGGLIFSLPMLYTMEVWWAGSSLHPGRLVLYVVVTFGLLLLYNRFAGLRRDASFAEVMIDSVEEMGLGLVVAAGVLWMTGQLSGDMAAAERIGKVIMEAMTVAIGVSVGTAQLGSNDEGDSGLGNGTGDQTGESAEAGPGYLPQAAMALCGGVLFAANIAPTEEIKLIAGGSAPSAILVLAALSILAAVVVLHFSGMHGTDRLVLRDTFGNRVQGVVTTYAMALVAAGACLFLFGNLDGEPFALAVSMVVVAGFPAVLGASAGRLLLQSGASGRK